MVRIILALFLTSLFVVSAAYFWLPWWGFLLVLVGLSLALFGAGRWLIGRLGARIFEVPFRAKGAVLNNAQAEVHSVRRVQAVQGEEGEGDAWYEVDVTITPRPTAGPFQLWEAAELMVLPARKSRRDGFPEGRGVRSLEVQSDGRFQPDEGLKYPGPQRLRFQVPVPADWGRDLAFGYYFSVFGKLTLPEDPGKG